MKMIGFHGRSTMRLVRSIVIIAATSITAAYAGDNATATALQGPKIDLAMTDAPFMQAFGAFNPDLKGSKFVLADHTELSERQADSIKPYRWRTICRVAARWEQDRSWIFELEKWRLTSASSWTQSVALCVWA
jgi:hypothetical protein